MESLNSSSDTPKNDDCPDREIELRRLALEELVAEQDYRIRLKELAMREATTRSSRWSNPLVLSIIAAAVAAAGNAYVSWLSGANRLAVEATRNSSQQEIEKERAEAERILEATKAKNPEESAERIRFLIEVGLISDPNRQAALEAYLEPKQPQTSATVTPSAESIVETYASGWLGGGNNQADQCRIGRAVVSQKHPGRTVLLKSSSEESKKDLLGRVEYRYFCEFEIK